MRKGSHKDRSLSIAITKAVEFGFDTCMLYSDGSAALSSAAYAARAGIRNINVTPAAAPDNRLLPLMVYGSRILEYQGSDADAVDWVHKTCRTLRIYETTTYRGANAYGAEGPKTISYEIVEDLSSVPDEVVVPVGGGGTLSGIFGSIHDSQGIFLYASDSEALNAHRRLGMVDGIYAEMSASVAVVAIDTMIQRSFLKENDTVVALVCGSGLLGWSLA